MKENTEKDKLYILSVLQEEFKRRKSDSENIKRCLQSVRSFCRHIKIDDITRTGNLMIFKGKYTIEISMGQMLEEIYILDIGKLHLKDDNWCFSFDKQKDCREKFRTFISEQQ